MNTNLDVMLNSSAATEFISLTFIMSHSQGSLKPSTEAYTSPTALAGVLKLEDSKYVDLECIMG